MSGFSDIAATYERRSIVPQQLGQKLFGYLDVGKTDDILDAGCGTGYFTRQLAAKTQGQVVGCDASAEMINEARRHLSEDDRIDYIAASIESTDWSHEFDLIFCNAALEWFHHPDLALYRCHHALRPGGMMAIQTLSRSCRVFASVTDALRTSSKTQAIFRHFLPPWQYFGSLYHYEEWVRSFGFHVDQAALEEITFTVPCHQAIEMFQGVEYAAYLNPACYAQPLTEGDWEAISEVMEEVIKAKKDDEEQVTLLFPSVFLLLSKQ